MDWFIWFLPGFIGAIVAFAALKVLGLFAFASLATEVLVFVVVYALVTAIADRAMQAYGHNRP